MEKNCSTCSKTFSSADDFLRGTNKWRVCSSGNLWFNCECGSTLLLPKGKFPWYSPDLAMGEEARDIFNIISQKSSLPHLSSTIMELQQLLTSPEEEVDTSELVRAVKRDPFLTRDVGKVYNQLKAVRGAVKKAEEDVDLSYAISFIGRSELANIVSVAAMKQLPLKTTAFDPEKHWAHSLLTANAAEFFWTHLMSPKGKEKAYLSGSLCNIGKVVAALTHPAELDSVWKECYSPATQDTWTTLEACSSMPDHGILGEIGAAFWGMPIYTLESIRHHHFPPESGLKHPDLVHIVCLANMVAHWINLEPHRIDEAQLEREKKYLKLSQERLESLIEELTNLLGS